jgi:hypothetical protein
MWREGGHSRIIGRQAHVHSPDEEVVQGGVDEQVDALLAAIPHFVDPDISLGNLETRRHLREFAW